MAQKAQVIDLTKSYLPWDPDAVMANYVSTEREDGEEKAIPVVPYEGWNFLPTSYGYKSYFGLNALLAIQRLNSRAQHIILYQGPDFRNVLIALCEDGIWMNMINSNSDWRQEVVVSFDPDVFEEWTWTVIENKVYMYHQGDSSVYTYEGIYGNLPNYMPTVVAVDSNFIPGIASWSTSSGGFTGAVGFSTYMLQIAKINTDGGFSSVSSAVTQYNATADELAFLIDVAPAATPGDMYRVFLVSSAAPAEIFYADVIANGSGQLDYNSYDSKIEILNGPPFDVIVAGGLTDALLKDNFYGITTAPITNNLAIGATPTGANAYPPGNYAVYLSKARRPSLVTSVAMKQVPYRLATINIATPSYFSITGDVTFDPLVADGTGYYLLLRNEDTGEIQNINFTSDESWADFTSDAYNYPGAMAIRNGVSVNYGGPLSTTIPVDFTVDSFTPSFLNMAGQMGIFRASTRLGFWDSANSVSWSSNFDLTDFEPSLENLAGNTIFGDVKGRIVTIKPYGTGFIIYSTKSIVGVSENLEGSMLWDGNSILDEIGIAHSRAVTYGQTDSEHFTYTNQGIFHINGFNSVNRRYPTEPIFTDIYDFLKEDRRPVFLTTLGSRYILFSLIDLKYISGRTTFQRQYVDPLTTHVKLSEGYWTGGFDWDDIYIDGNTSYQLLRTFIAGNTGGLHTRLGRRWNTRWDGEFVRMSTDVYTRAESLSWVRDLGVYTHPNPGLQHYVNAQRDLVDALDNDQDISQVALSPNLEEELMPDSSTVYRAGDYEFQFRDLHYVDTNGFSALDENDVGSKIYLQLQEWDNFKTTQAATADYINNKPIPTALEGSFTPFRFLAGDGPIKLVMNSKNFNHSMALRKYFTHEYEVDIVDSTGWKATFTGLQISSNDNPTAFSSNMTANESSMIPMHEMIEAWNPPYPYFYADLRYGYSPLSDPAILKITNDPEAYLYPGWIFSANAITIAKEFMRTHLDIIEAGVSNLTVFFASFYCQTTAGASQSPGTSFAQRAYGDLGGEGGFSQTEIFGTHTESGPVFSTNVYTWCNPGFYFLSSIKEYQATLVPIENPTYSEAQFNLRWYDLIEPRTGGGTRVIASYPASSRRIPFDNLYPDYSGEPAEINDNPEEFWSLVDDDGNYVISRIPADFLNGLFGGNAIDINDPAQTSPIVIPGWQVAGQYHPPIYLTFTLPGSSFLIQNGSITPLYNTFAGALVYDLQLKKWGKFKGEHKLIVETAPVNTNKDGIISYTDFGTDGGILDGSGRIFVFDTDPEDGYICYGKIGFYRLGVTHALEAHFDFRLPSTGTIVIDFSMDGRSIDPSLRITQDFIDAVDVCVYINQRARWAILKISGNYDLQYLEFRGNIAGRR